MARESRAIIIVHGHHTIRAGHGIHELFQTPTIELTAQVALRQDFVQQHESDSTFKPSSSDYLVGAQIQEAERAGVPLHYYWPMRSPGVVTDWQAMIALWKHLLFYQLNLKRSANASVTLLALPAPLSRSDQAYISSIFFEQLNCPGLSVVETPLLSAYATGTLNAAVVDIGWSSCTVTPIIDCLLQHQAIVHCPVGARHCTLWLAHLLRQDPSIVKALGALADQQLQAQSALSTGTDVSEQEQKLQQMLIELAELLVLEGHLHGLDEDDTAEAAGAGVDEEPELDVAAMLVEGKEKQLIEEQERRKQALQDAIDSKPVDAGTATAASAALTSEAGQAGGSTDPKAVLVTFKGMRIKVGPSRYRWAEPLYRPALLKNVRGAQPNQISHPPFAAGPVLGDPILSTLNRSAIRTQSDLDFENGTPSLPDAIALAIQQVPELDRRPLLWENLVITGAPTRIKGLSAGITRQCAAHISAIPPDSGVAGQGGILVADEPNSLQARTARALKVPDYFANFKERTDLAPFLGATIYAKLIFSDPTAKLYITKANHNEFGPAAAYTITAP